jgi:RES domain-containing protein
MAHIIEVFRIAKTKYADTAFDGEGAFRFGGRWNSRGTRMIYTAGSLALAVLEMLVHLDDDSMIQKYSFISAQIPEELTEKVENFLPLPKNWSISPAPLEVQEIGNKWVRKNVSAVLEVPSSVIPLEKNYLLNPAHKDFKKIFLGKPQKFGFDERLRSGKK